jgi:hypothetical protein
VTKCKEFCKNPKNKCDDGLVENYCKEQRAGNGNGNITYECGCILTPPSNDLERELNNKNNQNNACWSPLCRTGAVPKSDQFQLHRWWGANGETPNCTPITVCNVDLGDTNIDMYDRASFTIVNDCEQHQTASDLVKSNVTYKPVIESNPPSPESNPPSPAEDASIIKYLDWKFIIVVLALLFFCGIIYFRSRE